MVTHRALQCSVHRIVALERLKSDLAGNPEAVRQFRALVRAKAAVVHQHIASVYEAQESDGAVFYTREMVDGRTLPELLHAGVRLRQDAVLGLLQAAAEAAVYFDQRKIPRGPLTPRDVMLGRDGLPRVANIALGQPRNARDEHAEIVAMAQAAHAVVDTTTPTPELSHVLSRVRDPSAQGLHTWQAFVGAVAACRQKAADVDSPSTRKLSASTYAIVMNRRRRKRYVFAGIVASRGCRRRNPFSLAPLRHRPETAGFFRDVPRARRRVHLPERRKAVDARILDRHPRSDHPPIRHVPRPSAPVSRHQSDYDHPLQPSTKKSHVPQNWEAYHRAARRGGTYLGLRVNLNCPITTVDYWDAWAYARWKERRLPTEIEWEKAARGTDGRPFPWGRDAEPAQDKLWSGFRRHRRRNCRWFCRLGAGRCPPARPQSLRGDRNGRQCLGVDRQPDAAPRSPRPAGPGPSRRIVLHEILRGHRPKGRAQPRSGRHDHGIPHGLEHRTVTDAVCTGLPGQRGSTNSGARMDRRAARF